MQTYVCLYLDSVAGPDGVNEIIKCEQSNRVRRLT